MMPGMESVAILGLSEREHGASELARFTLSREQRVRRLPELKAALGVAELVYLATCNRVEILLHGRQGGRGEELRSRAFAAFAGREATPGEAERTFSLFRGINAVEHLFEVAAGLDSAALGEREIQGQLREALSEARAAGTAGGLAGRLVEEALKTARRVHLTTQLGRGRVSLAEIAGELLLERVRRTPSPVALIGVSPMTRRAAEVLRREGVSVIVVNRTLAHAERFLAELGGGECLALAEFRQRPPRVEALLSATGAPEPVLDRAALERLAARPASGEPPLVVDLAIPPDIDPEVAGEVEIPRIGIETVSGVARQGREAREAEAAAARALIDEALRTLRRRLTERALAPVVTRINQRFRDTALEGIERLLKKRGVALELDAREDLERWAETLARRFAHLPTLGLKGLAAREGLEAVRSFLAACDAELAAELPDPALEGEAQEEPAREGKLP